MRAALYYKDDRSIDNVRLVRALAASAVARAPRSCPGGR